MKRAEHQPEETEIALYAGIFCKLWRVADAGTLLPQHAHTYPHITLVMQGAVRAWRGEQMLGDYISPAVIRIPANELHNFLTLTNDVALACIHNAEEEPAIAREAHLDLED